MRLYRYFTSEYAIKAIEEKLVKVGRIDELNDPFDCYPKIEIDQELTDGRAYADFQGILKAWTKKIGIICYTSSITDPLMWAHYGDKHKGIALEFEIEENRSLRKIDYNIQRPTVKGVELELLPADDAVSYELSIIENSFSGKAPSWNYENEYRIFYPLHQCYAKKGLFFTDLPKVLKRVILGARSSVDEEHVKTILSNSGHQNVEIAKAELSETTFTIKV